MALNLKPNQTKLKWDPFLVKTIFLTHSTLIKIASVFVIRFIHLHNLFGIHGIYESKLPVPMSVTFSLRSISFFDKIPAVY